MIILFIYNNFFNKIILKNSQCHFIYLWCSGCVHCQLWCCLIHFLHRLIAPDAWFHIFCDSLNSLVLNTILLLISDKEDKTNASHNNSNRNSFLSQEFVVRSCRLSKWLLDLWQSTFDAICIIKSNGLKPQLAVCVSCANVLNICRILLDVWI